jgi:hypothetical protein
MTPIMVPDMHPPSADLLALNVVVLPSLHGRTRALGCPSALNGELSRAIIGATDRIPMIGRLTGILVEKNPPQLLLDVQGVGTRSTCR